MRIFLKSIVLEDNQSMAHHEASGSGGYGSSPHMKTVAWSILVMGVSLAIVIILYIWFGWIPGSGYSDEIK
jgi:hypothetical protein